MKISLKQKLALIFPGQGSQQIGMGKDFFADFKESKLRFEEANDTLHRNIAKLCFEGPEDKLTATENLQPCLFVVEMAIYSALAARVPLDAVVAAGHSLGEYSALCAAGSLEFRDGVVLTALRGKAMQEACPPNTGAMAAVIGKTNSVVQTLCSEAEKSTQKTLSPANYNGTEQIVIAGHADAMAKAIDLAKNDSRFDGMKIKPLAVSAPFHCDLMRPAQPALSKALSQVQITEPRFPVISNVTAQRYSRFEEIAGLLTDQIVRPVRWVDSFAEIKRFNPEAALEIGPGKVLTGLLKRLDKDFYCVPINQSSNLTEVFE